MNDLEEILTRTLHDHAEPEVPIDRLLTVTRERGRRRQRARRAAGLGAGAALTVAALVAASAAVPALAGHRDEAMGPAGAAGTPSDPATAKPPASATPLASPAALTGLPALPVAVGAVTARTDPTVIGRDARLLHFEVDPAVLPARLDLAEWRSLDGLEDLNVQATRGTTTGNPSFRLQVSHQAGNLEPLPPHGHQVHVGAGTGTSSVDGSAAVLRWQPVPGVWAQVQVSGGESAALRVAQAVGFDRVSRCVVPFRLTSVPAGASVDTCAVTVMATGATGRMSLHLPAGASGGASAGSEVTVEVDRPGSPITNPSQTIGGSPATVREYQGDGKHLILQVDVDHTDHLVDLLAEGHYDRAVVLSVADGFRDAGGADPVTWPLDPLS